MDFAWIRRRAKHIGRTELLTGSLILFGLILLLVEGIAELLLDRS